MQIPDVAITVEEITDPYQLAQARHRRESFDRNAEWLQGQISKVYSQHRGKFICIAGEELFVADTAEDAIAQATAAHPQDGGWFTRYIPKEKVAGVYAI